MRLPGNITATRWILRCAQDDKPDFTQDSPASFRRRL